VIPVLVWSFWDSKEGSTGFQGNTTIEGEPDILQLELNSYQKFVDELQSG